MKADDCRIWRERIGALVLGQLDADERTATEAHLDGCSGCRAEAEALAPVAAMLSRANPERLTPAPAPPADLGDRIARRIAAERRAARRRHVRLGLGLGA
ncbi:MAG: anti-sigma factor family protein, partial [Solirubrobacterales bacterium]